MARTNLDGPVANGYLETRRIIIWHEMSYDPNSKDCKRTRIIIRVKTSSNLPDLIDTLRYDTDLGSDAIGREHPICCGDTEKGTRFEGDFMDSGAEVAVANQVSNRLVSHRATENGYPAVIKLLLKCGKDPIYNEAYGFAALLRSSSQGCIETHILLFDIERHHAATE